MNKQCVIQDAAVGGLLNQLVDHNLSCLVNQKTTRYRVNDYFMAPMSFKMIRKRNNLIKRITLLLYF